MKKEKDELEIQLDETLKVLKDTEKKLDKINKKTEKELKKEMKKESKEK